MEGSWKAVFERWVTSEAGFVCIEAGSTGGVDIRVGGGAGSGTSGESALRSVAVGASPAKTDWNTGAS